MEIIKSHTNLIPNMSPVFHKFVAQEDCLDTLVFVARYEVPVLVALDVSTARVSGLSGAATAPESIDRE